MSEIALKDYGTREAWLAARAEGVGASEVAALFYDQDGRCVSPFQTAFSLWLEKTGQVPAIELDAEWLEWGLLLEEPIARRYERVTGRRIWQGGPYCVAVHATLPRMRATPDRWVIEAPDRGGQGLLQVKNTHAFAKHDWDEGPPDFIRIQVQSEMAVTARDWDSVAVLIGGNEFRTFDVDRDDDFIREAEEQVRWFWSLVESGVAPPIDASQRTLDAIKRLHPADNGEEARLPEEAVAWLDQLLRAKDGAKVADAAKTEAEAKLRAAIGAATFGALPDGRRVSLKTTERKGYTTVVEPCTYRTLRLEKAPTTTKARTR
jgi:putative phage-type endonuclease